jgi:D-glycero-D-manno-heptose 1,7-bisphosphate phosphatase
MSTRGRRFVMLDRDGTIVVERHYLSDPDQVELTEGAAAGLRRLMGLGLGLVVVTNQSGLGRGYFDRGRLELVHERLRQLLADEGVRLDGIYVCPHTPDDGCACRKPEVALVEQAAREQRFDPRDAFMIGDNRCDLELGRRVGAITILVRTGYGRQVAEDPAAAPDLVAGGLAEAAELVEGRLVAGGASSGG